MKIFRQDVPTQKPRDHSSVTFLDAPAVSQQEACRMYRVTIYVYKIYVHIVSICVVFVHRVRLGTSQISENARARILQVFRVYNMYVHIMCDNIAHKR